MLKVLTQYFAKNGQLVLPNIGWVHLEKQEATWVDDVLIAPRESIVLDASLTKYQAELKGALERAGVNEEDVTKVLVTANKEVTAAENKVKKKYIYIDLR